MGLKDITDDQSQRFLMTMGASMLQFNADRHLSDSMRKCFPYNSSIEFVKERREDKWDQQARELWQTGYTTWQHNLSALQGDGYKHITLSLNSDATKYEYHFYVRSLMMCANFLVRHQGGAEVKDVQTYFKETFDQSDSGSFAYQATAQSVFLNLLGSFVNNLIENPENLSSAIDALIMSTHGVAPGGAFGRNAESLKMDLILKKIRAIVQGVLKGDAPAELKGKCVELLMRLGLMAGNPEDLILAAQYQFEFKIDISRHLEFFLKQSELFEEPKSAEEEVGGGFENSDKKRIQNRCSYGEGPGDRQHPHDKLACDGANYYTFSSARGLSKAAKNSESEWAITKVYAKAEDLKEVTLLTHQGNLYIRHSGAPDVPFQQINKETMEIIEDATPITAAEGEEHRFRWPKDDDPVHETPSGNRWLTITPMCSDGKYIYAMTNYREGAKDSTRKSTWVEVYELKENQYTFIRELELKDKAERPWAGRASLTEAGGYLDHGSCASSGTFFVWHSRKNIHIFNLKTGILAAKHKVHTGNHLSTFDSLSSNWYSQDADCYSWLDEWKIKGFKAALITEAEDEEGEAQLPQVPVILDEPKGRVRKNLRKTKEPEYQLNLFSQLIGGAMEVQAKADSLEEYTSQRTKIAEAYAEADKDAEEREDLLADDWVFDYTRAIILSHVSTVAQEKNFYARAKTSSLDGEAMLKFFKEKHGIQVGESVFSSLRHSLCDVLDNFDLESAHITERFTLKSLLHIYLAHIGCLKPLRISIRQIMSENEMTEQQDLLKSLREIQLYPGQKERPAVADDLGEDWCFQLHIYHLAKQAVSEMEDLISTQTIGEKLADMLVQLKSLQGQANSEEVIRLLRRYQIAEFAELFDQDADVLEIVQEIFTTVLGLINERVDLKAKDAFSDKAKIEDEFQGFGSEETMRLCEFAVTFLQELMVNYGNCQKAIDESQPDKDAGEGDDAVKAEAKKAKTLRDATEKLEKINDLFYECMIQACASFKAQTKSLALLMLTTDYAAANYEEGDHSNLYKMLDNLLSGKYSLLRAILMFIMTIQCYEVDTTDLDEVAEALGSAEQGLNYFTAGCKAFKVKGVEHIEEQKKLADDIEKTQRFVAFALNSVASRLMSGKSENDQATSTLLKYSILKNGIASKFIPQLSDDCKKEIEGSFKITKDAELQQAAKADASDISLDDRDKLLARILWGQDDDVKKLPEMLKSDDEQESADPAVEDLVRAVFTTMVHFQKLDREVQNALSQADQDSSDWEIDAALKQAWTEATKMRVWERKTFQKFEQKLLLTQTTAFKAEYAENYPSKPALEGKLSDEHQATVDGRVQKEAKNDLEKVLSEAIKKCEFLLKFEEDDTPVPLDVAGLVVENFASRWSTWETSWSPSAIDKRRQASEADSDAQKRDHIQGELLEIAQAKTSCKELQDFTEGGLVAGLRRLAGMVMLNQTFSQNEGPIFYDALHMFEASLRGNKAELGHYLDGVPGCGHNTEHRIRDQFFESITIITKMLCKESDPQKLVLLINSLMWDYVTSDLQVLATANVFPALAGGENKFSTLASTWGKERKYFSVENLDQESPGSKKYSLSGRLRQAFDFLVAKVYSVVYDGNGVYHRNDKLGVIGAVLLQQINEVVFGKLKQHLDMMPYNTAQAAAQRDEDIRFDAECGESPDSTTSFMIDQCQELGANCIEKAANKTRKERERKVKIVNAYIRFQAKGGELTTLMSRQLCHQLGLDQIEELADAILSRHSLVFDACLAVAGEIASSLELDLEEEKAEDEEEEAPEGAETFQRIKGELESKSGKEKAEAWLVKLREEDGKTSPLEGANFFSRVSIVRLLKPLLIMISVSESSKDNSELLKQVMNPGQLSILIRMAALGTSQTQCLLQKIFQCLLRLNMPQKQLDEVVKFAAAEDAKTGRVAELSSGTIFKRINFKSSFWHFQLNQIYLAKRAQFSTSNQVEVGKSAVIEEIIRTFLTITTKDQPDANFIRKKIEEALQEVERLSDAEIATLFSLVPESHTPLISTGKRCYDEESKQHFICLGFANSNAEQLYETQLSLVQTRNTQVIGLVINTGSQQAQTQKSYSLMNVSIATDVDLSRVAPADEQNHLKSITLETSIYMNPEIVGKLLQRMTAKDQILRNAPEQQITQQFLQIYIQNGIFHMLQLFEREYLTNLKSYNQLETLINFLAKESAIQSTKPEEPLVSAALLAMQASEVYISATHTPRSTGYYCRFLIYIDDGATGAAILQRVTDDNHYEFMDMPVIYSVGDAGRSPSMCEEGHALSTFYGGGDNADVSIKCKKCEGSLNSIEKTSQKKTGFMRCLECTSDVNFCNDCVPGAQVKTQMGLNVAMNTLGAFRIARQAVLFMSAEDLLTMTDRILTTMITANIIIVDQNAKAPLPKILEALGEKVLSDNKWKACATCRFILVDAVPYLDATKFLMGESVVKESSRGRLLTQICSRVEIAQKRISSEEDTHSFVTKFLQEKGQGHEEFLGQTVPNILTEEIATDFKEEQKERQREEKKMLDQLKTLNEPKQLENSESIRSISRSQVSSSGDKTPDFMKKFTAESDKLIQEGGKEFFNPVKVNNEDSELRNRFDEIAFETDSRNPGELQRKQLKSCLSKITQITASQIWLRLMSIVSDNPDDLDTQNIINATAMHPKICNLIHERNMSASYQTLYFGDSRQQRVVRGEIEKLLRFFDSGAETQRKFIGFFVKDFLKRADLTIEQVRKDNYTELGSYKLRDLRKVSKLPNVFDPNNLLFLSKQIFQLDFFQGNIKAEMAKVLFDLHLGFAILYKSEQDAVVSLELVKGCAAALDEILKNLETFVSNSSSVNALLTSAMITELFVFMEGATETTGKRQLMSEIIIKLNKIFVATKKKNPDDSPRQPPFKRDEKINNLIAGYAALEHGRSFTALLPQIKLDAMLHNQESAKMVEAFGQFYQTDKKMFCTYFKKTFKPEQDIVITVEQSTTKKCIQIQKTADMKSIMVDAASLGSGKENRIRVDKGEEVTIEFPVSVNEVKMSGQTSIRNCSEDAIKKEDFEPLEGIDQISALSCYAKMQHVMFVGADEQIMGMGYRASGKGEGAHKLRIIEKPDGCCNYQRVAVAKFCRLVLTKEGKLFFSGQNKKYMAGKDISVDEYAMEFNELSGLWPLDTDDKLVDIAGGLHFMIACTEKGKVYSSGYMFYRAVSEIRSNSEDNEDYPCELSVPEGWLARRVWACDKYQNAWMLAEKSGQPGTFQTFSCGGDYDMVGGADRDGAPNWRKPAFGEGIYMKEISSQGMSAYGIDQNGCLWEWGDHKVSNEGDEKLWEMPEGCEEKRSTPYKFVWFTNKNKTVEKVASGDSWALIQARDNTSGQLEMYGLGDCNKDGRMGADSKDMYNGDKLVLLGAQISHDDVIDFACTRGASFVIMQKAVEQLPSILADEPEYRGLVHFYRNKGKWIFIKEEDLAMQVDRLPELVYATRHPIKDFEAALIDDTLLPDCQKISSRADIRKRKEAFQVTTTNGGRAISGESLYYAKTSVDGKVSEVMATMSEVREGGNNFDLQPLVWYVLKGPIVELSTLPALDANRLFHRSTQDNESMSYQITNAELDHDAINAIEITDELQSFMGKVACFEPLEDFDLLRAIDERIKSLSSELSKVKKSQFEPNLLQLSATSPLKSMDRNLVFARVGLLLELSQSVDKIVDHTFFSKDIVSGSMADLIKDNHEILLPDLKQIIFKKQMKGFWEERDTQCNTVFTYDYKKAHNFMKKGLKNNPTFITESTFGQLYQVCNRNDANFTMMQNNGNSFNYDLIDKQETDRLDTYCNPAIFRNMEIELMSNQLPIFIKTPNGRLNMGIKRDCYIVNSKMMNPDWMKCYQFIGAYLGRVIVQDHLSFNVPMAPTFWMLLLNQENALPDLKDYAREDCRLAKLLDKINVEEEELFDSEIEWIWFNSTDEKVYITERAPGAELHVKFAEVDTFKMLLRDFLNDSAKEAMSHIRMGLKHSLGEKSYLTEYINWHDAMVLTETPKAKTHDIALFKEATEYVNCAAADNMPEWFWTIFEQFNYEDKKAYLNFVSGRSRTAYVPARASQQKHKPLRCKDDHELTLCIGTPTVYSEGSTRCDICHTTQLDRDENTPRSAFLRCAYCKYDTCGFCNPVQAQGYEELLFSPYRNLKHTYFKNHVITVDASKSEGAEITSNPEEFELILAPSYESQDAFKDALMAALSKAHISSRYI